MSPLGALFKKELLEIAGDRQSRRGGLIQGFVFVLLLGAFTVKPELWLLANPKAIFYFAFLPGVAAAAVAADAFAGERERRTLDTLLASPIGERTILLGKTAAAVTFGTLVGALGLGAAVGMISVFHHAFVPALSLVAGAIGASIVSSLLMASVAISVSMLVPVVRAAQQIASVSSVVILAAGVFLWQAYDIRVTWGSVFAAECAIAAVALASLEIGNRTFRRERFFTGTHR